MALNFEGVMSSDEIWFGEDTNECLTDVVNSKASVGHTHTGYATSGHTHTGYADADHTHDGFAAANHTHDPAVIGAAYMNHAHNYAEIDHGHSGYADASHTHAYSDITGAPAVPTIPESLPANGGNADTVDNMHASDFAAAGHTHTGFAAADHTHTGFAAEGHTHSDYAAANHGHTGYASAEHVHSGYADAEHTHSGYAAANHSHSDIDTALDGKAPKSHASTGTEYGVASGTAYGHAKASGTTPKAPGTAAVGSETGTFARGDHVHPDQEMMRGITSGGTGAAYTATVAGIEVLAAGVSFVMVPHVVSAATVPTLNVNNLGAKPIRRRLSSSTISTVPAATENWLGANKPIRMIYDGAFWIAGDARPNAPDMYGTLAIEHGGTGADTAAEALANLGGVPSTGGTFTGPVTIKPQLYTAQILPFDGGSYSIGSSDYRYYSTYLRVNPNVSSDCRCKRDISIMDVNALAAFVDKLHVVNYNYNDDAADEARRIGLIAQDVIAADPVIAMGCVEQDDKGFYSLRTADLVYPLIAAVQALTKRVEELEGK